jgi:molybdopterin/thiamine biosynthesis adenylyltransferase
MSHDLDWREVGTHKAASLARRIKLVNASATCKTRLHRLGGQESSGSIETLISTLSKCDLIIDATANPASFNYLTAAATYGEKPLLWAEIFGGGFGGLIARHRPGDRVQLMAVDPPGEYREQQLKRLKRWGHCSGVYGLTNRRGSLSGRLAHCPIASFDFLDTTGRLAAHPNRRLPDRGSCPEICYGLQDEERFTTILDRSQRFHTKADGDVARTGCDSDPEGCSF